MESFYMSEFKISICVSQPLIINANIITGLQYVTPPLKMYSKFVLPNCTVFSHNYTEMSWRIARDRPLL